MPLIAIVDPYSSGALLAAALTERGASCLAVESSTRLPPAIKSGFEPGRFATVIQHAGDLESTLAAVAACQPTRVLAGFESGVELAEQLAERLGLPTNGPKRRTARRDKFLMVRAAHEAGLRTARQLSSSDIGYILDRVDKSMGWPVVLKPHRSVATDQVFCCQDHDQARQAASAILSQPNILGERNESILAQEFLAGTEYAVDTVSCNGHHKVTAIWQYLRPPDATAAFVGYDAMLLLPYRGRRQDALQSYALDTLAALEISDGPAHCEMMWVASGPVLMEVGARLSAGNNATLSRDCGGICQLDETVDSILAANRFRETGQQQPQLSRYAANVFLMPQRPGRLIRTQGLEIIRELPTLHAMSVRTSPGELVGRVAGLVTLLAEGSQALERDIDVIRQQQRQGLFVVAEDCV